MTHGSSPSADAAIRVPGLARVEGEGGLEIRVRDGEVVEARLNIYEPLGSSRRSSGDAVTPSRRTSRPEGSARSPTR